ncbi:hypothetical protein ACFFX1_54795 [Dactylosporangium sucinum]|uniref:DeoxyPurine in DNA protein A domain-containing protein n=1 Tax=Dactylosporangium sucinum TaxID=1424081 RepID=A0A917X1U5_9ACTN|nr:hypothetical protein [Dactylosporangium sucinum]GGM53621.1 hypothetical protein GCM10007977_064000 [Dactylosporangium sucinum]
MGHFYLGTHQPHWLALPPRDRHGQPVPLFVSHRRLAGRTTLPRARTNWALDSGGFSELSLYGRWQTTPDEYLAAVRRYDTEIGMLSWAAPQDWMCEPIMLAKTGLTVAEHQRRTVANFKLLRDLWWDSEDADLQTLWDRPDAAHTRDPEFCPFMPVLQGWSLDDYLRCVDLYEAAGVHLWDHPVVGVGSVCRRQATGEIEAIFDALSGLDLLLHGFGVKTSGLARYGHHLATADSMAWSFDGRRTPTRCGSTTHINEANCLTFALDWYKRLGDIGTDREGQLTLDLFQAVAA